MRAIFLSLSFSLSLSLALLSGCSTWGGSESETSEAQSPAALQPQKQGVDENSSSSILSLGPSTTAAKRIVSLAPSLTDVVIALGAAHRLAGVTRFDDAPEVEGLPRVGGYTDPSVEAVVRLEPDLVLCQPAPGNRGAVEQLARAGIAVRVLDLRDLADVESAYREVGSVLGKQARASELISQLHADLKTARERSSRRQGKVPQVVLLYGIDPLYAAGPTSFGDDLIKAAGGENLVSGSAQPWPRLSVEWLAARNPDAVLLSGPGAGALENPQLPAGLKLETRVLESSGFLRPGPGVNGALEELGDIFDELSRKNSEKLEESRN